MPKVEKSLVVGVYIYVRLLAGNVSGGGYSTKNMHVLRRQACSLSRASGLLIGGRGSARAGGLQDMICWGRAEV